MPDRPFISRELDRRIVSAEAAIAAGRMAPETAEANLKPWAAAEAWLAGHPFPGTSPRDGHSRASDICPIDRVVEVLSRARDRLAAEIQDKGRDDLQGHWRDMAEAVRLIERQRDGMAAWRMLANDHTGDVNDMADKPAPPAPPPTVSIHESHVPPPLKPALPLAQPSLLADMFDADGKPLQVQRNAA